MLTDTTLRGLKPGPTSYKVSDCDGMYVLVTTAGCISLRYDYRLNGSRETFALGAPRRTGPPSPGGAEPPSDRRRMGRGPQRALDRWSRSKRSRPRGARRAGTTKCDRHRLGGTPTPLASGHRPSTDVRGERSRAAYGTLERAVD